ncbi:CNH-domain-containing protein [Cylindrobasidium torrendii FP15055 ss-10]|uniref:CNH-domain-containing protein n=1 Tax=Cylindrobasidium torrendii FP15055 ss-10 TaxID=1314674 RepID=A0A0D7BQJ2_9AGAR|nr:CNH-domain-containing protein [Cylindrobasidium torrendii FP15055 ss-10]
MAPSYQQPIAPNGYYMHPQASMPPAYGYGGYAGGAPSLAPPSMVGRARSINSSGTMGIIATPPRERPDPSLEAWTDKGMTPAQAYQAQVYLNGPQPTSPTPSLSRSPELPRLPQLASENGRLNIDFTSSGSGEDGLSELPWARTGRTPPPPASNRFSQASSASSAENMPLHIDTKTAQSVRSSVISTSPSALSVSEHSAPDMFGNGPTRRSSESGRTIPRIMNGPRSQKTVQDRTMSMSTSASSARPSVRTPATPVKEGRASPTSVRNTRKTPVVYPALLSRVAEAFRDRITTGDRLKDGLDYKDAFDGREAVDKIAYIIKTTDRNLALLLGRALDAQKFFHDVTYDHRLRDTPNELYRFRTKIASPFVSGQLEAHATEPAKTLSADGTELPDSTTPSPSASIGRGHAKKPSVGEDDELPSGVFTLLTDCYSPTCSRDQLCYSIACPRRLEQQARLNMKPQPGLSKQLSKESLVDPPEDGTLWIHSVPQEIVDSVSDAEKRRQEAINEVIYTERDFVRDMEYLRDVWIKRLQESDDIIPAERRTQFLEQVFWNLFDIIAVNSRVRDALLKRQKSYAVVEKIGDILRDAVPHFAPFVSYGAHQLYGKYEFEREKGSNPAFAAFVEATERFPESRKLELNAYLTKPTTRLARYPLLLEAVLKHTADDNPDKKLLPEVIAEVRKFLARVNEESGKTENRFNLAQLDKQLVWRTDRVDLHLLDEGRELVYKGPLNKRDGEITVYLFDHALLFTKTVKIKQHDQLRVYRPPIPLELLCIMSSEDSNIATLKPRKGQSLVKASSVNRDHRISPAVMMMRPPEGAKGPHWINFFMLGRKTYSLCLWATSAAAQRKWMDTMYKQQKAMRDRSYIFDTVPLSEGFFVGVNKVNCAAPMNGGRRVVYGTNDGVYMSDLREPNQEPVKVLALQEVVQIDVLEDYDLLIVLSERQVITFPLDALEPLDPLAGLKRAKRISSHTSFFKAGFCLGKILVCIVKSTQLSSTFKTLEPIDQTVRGRNKPTFKKLLQGGNDTLKMFREFYIPVESTSIHYLKTKMCVGCSRGFEIVDLETLDTQGLLDPLDPDLEFVRRKENLKPMAIYRIQNEFLLCYDEFAIYVNKSGQRAHKDFLVQWEGTPTGFALHEPYVLAFEPSFVEIRHIKTGALSQVIQGSNLRLLFADNPPSHTNNGGGHYNQHHHQQSYGYPGYNQPQMYGGGYPSTSTVNINRYLHSTGRDEILMVSDDRVFALRMVQDVVGVTPSVVSMR